MCAQKSLPSTRGLGIYKQLMHEHHVRLLFHLQGVSFDWERWFSKRSYPVIHEVLSCETEVLSGETVSRIGSPEKWCSCPEKQCFTGKDSCFSS